MTMINEAYLQANTSRFGSGDATQSALKLYRRLRAQAWIEKARSSVTGRTRNLIDLESVEDSVTGRHYLGTRAVSLRLIRGSEGRSKDFDATFRPLNAANKSRWMSVATAHIEGLPLPRVELIQVGDVYFVRDGHHRISVAKALGQEYIDADVTVWEVAGPLPWGHASRSGSLAVQPA